MVIDCFVWAGLGVVKWWCLLVFFVFDITRVVGLFVGLCSWMLFGWGLFVLMCSLICCGGFYCCLFGCLFVRLLLRCGFELVGVDVFVGCCYVWLTFYWLLVGLFGFVWVCCLWLLVVLRVLLGLVCWFIVGCCFRLVLLDGDLCVLMLRGLMVLLVGFYCWMLFGWVLFAWVVGCFVVVFRCCLFGLFVCLLLV